MGLRDHSHLLQMTISNAVGVTRVKERAPSSSASEDMTLKGVQHSRASRPRGISGNTDQRSNPGP